MKSVFLALVLCCIGLRAGALESKSVMLERASKVTIAQLNEQIKQLKGAKAASSSNFAAVLRCDPDPQPEPSNCVPHCTTRYSDGSCAGYTSDFCGPNAVCVPHCTTRYSDGSCAGYTSDNCGPWASCSPNCTTRYSDGSCAGYSGDICN